MNILNYMQFLNEGKETETEKEQDTMKKKVLDFAEKNKRSTWKELQGFIVKEKGYDPNDRDNRGLFSSYFSGNSIRQAQWEKGGKHGRGPESHGLLMRPTQKDKRYLQKEGKHYIVQVWDGENILP